MQISKALTFMAVEREQVEEDYAGDIIGLHNHGSIQIGDSFTQGEKLKFKGIPNFALEIFKRVKLNDPLKMKALQKGLVQLSEEWLHKFSNLLYLMIWYLGLLVFCSLMWLHSVWNQSIMSIVRMMELTLL